MMRPRAPEDIQADLDFWWSAHQDWINAPLGDERDEGLALCNERLLHFVKEQLLVRKQVIR